MKVIHLISGGDSGGAKTHVLSLLQNLNKTITAQLVCFRDGPFAEEARTMGIPTMICGGNNIPHLRRELADYIRQGVRVAGGCCGTTPEHIAKLHAACAGLSPVPPFSKQTIYLSSGAQAVDARALDLASLAPIAVPDSLDDLLDEVFDRQDEEVPVLRLDFSQSSLPPLDAVEAVQEISRLPLWLEGADAGIRSFQP